MDVILGLAPLAALLCFAAALTVRFSSWGPKKAFLRATVIWGAYLVLTTELLSLISALTRPALLAAWLLPTAIILGLNGRALGERVRARSFGLGWTRSPLAKLCLLLILVVLVVTAVIAWVSPPNTYDSLTYHMSRVSHWAQDRSLAPFATGILRQAYMSPGAEYIVLHLYILGGGDRLANFAEWLAMVVCMIAAAKIAQDLGSTQVGQWIAALFVATLPMGIAQASSTMTDFVAALWVACAVSEVIESYLLPARADHFIFMSLAAGLAILVKPTGPIYLIPFAILALWILVRNFRPVDVLLLGAAGAAAVCAINLGFLARNLEVFGHPFGPAGQTGTFTNSLFSWRVLVSNLLRNASIHAGTASKWLNDQLYTGIAKVHVKIGLAMDDPRTSVHDFFSIRKPIPAENSVGNPWQATLALIAAGFAILRPRSRRAPLLVYLALLAASFVLFSAVFKFTVLGSRYHVTFFVLLAPFVGTIFGGLGGWAQWPVVAVLGLSAITPLLSLRERPLLTRDGKPGIFQQSRQEILLSTSGVGEAYSRFAGMIDQEACSEVGVKLRGDSPEYPIWVLLGAPRSDLKIDWIIARGDPTGRFRDPAFQPCAVICQDCSSTREPFNDLPWVAESHGLQLYLKQGAVP
jgi:hypothetical protein